MLHSSGGIGIGMTARPCADHRPAPYPVQFALEAMAENPR